VAPPSMRDGGRRGLRRRPFLAVALGVFLASLLLSLAPASLAQERELLLGASVSLSGKYSKEGSHVVNGYNLAVKWLNRRGGLKVGKKTYKARIIYRDDGSDPGLAARNAEKLIDEDGVRFMLGPYGSTITREVQKVTERHRMPLVQANGASRVLLNKNNRFHFAVLSPANLYFASAVDFFAEQLKESQQLPNLKTAGLIFEPDTFSQDVRLGALERLNRYGIRVVLDEKFPEDLEDIRPALAKAKEVLPDLLLISGHARGAATAARQIAELEVDALMIAMTHCAAAQIEIVAPKGAEHTVCVHQWHKDLEYRDDDHLFGRSQDFVRLFRGEYGYEPPYHAVQSAAAIQVLAGAIRSADSLNPDDVREALAATDMRSLYGDIRFDETGGNVAKPMVLTQIIDGEYVLVSPDDVPGAGEVVYPRTMWGER